MVTVQASASAELGATPMTEWPRFKRMSSRKMAESGDIELSAMGNIRSSNGKGSTRLGRVLQQMLCKFSLLGHLTESSEAAENVTQDRLIKAKGQADR